MTGIRKLFRVNVTIQVVAVLVIILSIFCCGRKGPPVPPQQKEVPAVNNLESILEGDKVVLSWSVPSGKEGKAAEVTGFIIYQAKYSLTQDICEECPINYKPVSEVSADLKTKDNKMKYIKQLDKGFKYFFKVTAYSKTVSSESKDSNIIKFDY